MMPTPHGAGETEQPPVRDDQSGGAVYGVLLFGPVRCGRPVCHRLTARGWDLAARHGEKRDDDRERHAHVSA
jgi:hypothetical protein